MVPALRISQENKPKRSSTCWIRSIHGVHVQCKMRKRKRRQRLGLRMKRGSRVRSQIILWLWTLRPVLENSTVCQGMWFLNPEYLWFSTEWFSNHIASFISSVQLLNCVRLFRTWWTAARQTSLSITKVAQTHVHRVGDAIQPSHPL